ncbi:MAG: hypothetical protein II663_00955 [Bacteroidales bacterium]|nr:hypothetical protein [Bacteroidales bacterium]
MRTFQETIKAVENVKVLQEKIDNFAQKWADEHDYQALDDACKLIDKRDYTIRGIKATLRTLLKKHNWEQDGMKYTLDNLVVSRVSEFEYLWW